jgi:hypothetical protein
MLNPFRWGYETFPIFHIRGVKNRRGKIEDCLALLPLTGLDFVKFDLMCGIPILSAMLPEKIGS